MGRSIRIKSSTHCTHLKIIGINFDTDTTVFIREIEREIQAVFIFTEVKEDR